MEREWLKVYETLPAQLLNVYGEAKYGGMADKAVWEHLNKPFTVGRGI